MATSHTHSTAFLFAPFAFAACTAAAPAGSPDDMSTSSATVAFTREVVGSLDGRPIHVAIRGSGAGCPTAESIAPVLDDAGTLTVRFKQLAAGVSPGELSAGSDCELRVVLRSNDTYGYRFAVRELHVDSHARLDQVGMSARLHATYRFVGYSGSFPELSSEVAGQQDDAFSLGYVAPPGPFGGVAGPWTTHSNHTALDVGTRLIVRNNAAMTGTGRVSAIEDGALRLSLAWLWLG